jgi:hypothetical protein
MAFARLAEPGSHRSGKVIRPAAPTDMLDAESRAARKATSRSTSMGYLERTLSIGSAQRQTQGATRGSPAASQCLRRGKFDLEIQKFVSALRSPHDSPHAFY